LPSFEDFCLLPDASDARADGSDESESDDEDDDGDDDDEGEDDDDDDDDDEDDDAALVLERTVCGVVSSRALLAPSKSPVDFTGVSSASDGNVSASSML
jgi:hypothetical protein